MAEIKVYGMIVNDTDGVVTSTEQVVDRKTGKMLSDLIQTLSGGGSGLTEAERGKIALIPVPMNVSEMPVLTEYSFTRGPREWDGSEDFVSELDPGLPDAPLLKLHETVRRQFLIDRVRLHGGDYESGAERPFRINGLELTYEEALTVDEESCGGIFVGSYARMMGQARTFYAIRPHAQSPYSNYAFLGCRNLEVVAVDEGGDPLVVTGTTFAECQSLRRILGPISLATSVCFADCGMLEEIDPVNGVTRDLDFTLNPNLSADCYRRMLNNTSGSARYTIKVTSEVWQRIKNGSDESWYSLWSLAGAKNVSFAVGG